MSRFRPRLWLAVSILVLGTAIAGGVVAATQPSDEQALQPTGTLPTTASSRV